MVYVILMYHRVIPLAGVLLSLARVSPQAGSAVIWKRLGASLFSALNYLPVINVIIRIASLHMSYKAGLIRWGFFSCRSLMIGCNILMGKEQGISLSASTQSHQIQNCTSRFVSCSLLKGRYARCFGGSAHTCQFNSTALETVLIK